MDESRFVSVYTIANRFEGDLLMDALKRENVPAILRTFEETAYDGLFVPQRGWGQILVPEENAPEAHEALAPLINDLHKKLSSRDSRETRPVTREEYAKGKT
ncbi:MAG: hypothetical protein JSU72_15365 [Deltaproteobacteria bacterium]|nr:MAG: hypothetical protein JSU72_15365 [Deltaproteobacteria bacterium]